MTGRLELSSIHRNMSAPPASVNVFELPTKCKRKRKGKRKEKVGLTNKKGRNRHLEEPRTPNRPPLMPGEYKERKSVRCVIRNLMKRGDFINTEIHYGACLNSPNPEVCTTTAEADAIAKDLVAPCSSKVCTWVSQDQEKLLVYLPQILGGLWHKGEERKIVGAATNAIAELVAGYPPPALDNSKRRHCVDKPQPHLPHGIFNFGFWRQQGHPQDPPTLSRHMVNITCGRVTLVNRFLHKIAPIVQTMGLLFGEVDPHVHRQYQASFASWLLDYTEARLLKVSERACFMNLAVLVNARVGPHKDHRDVKYGWAGMLCFGDWQGGELVLPALRAKIAYKQGDVIFFRSALLEHFLTAFSGSRTCLVFFTKANMMPDWKRPEERSGVRKQTE